MKRIKITPKLLKILKAYTKLYNQIEDEFHKKRYKLEKQMEKETGIEDIEFFHCDGEFGGIGNVDRTMELIHRDKLEK